MTGQSVTGRSSHAVYFRQRLLDARSLHGHLAGRVDMEGGGGVKPKTTIAVIELTICLLSVCVCSVAAADAQTDKKIGLTGYLMMDTYIRAIYRY